MWKILIVDDVAVTQQLILEMLCDVAQCDVASDGQEAIDFYKASLKKEPYDLILSDIMMPKVNGLELLTRVRAFEQELKIPLEKGIPIIMMSGHQDPFEEAFNKGCTDYLLKPFETDQLISKIKESLEKGGG